MGKKLTTWPWKPPKSIGINKEKVQGEETIIGESHLIDGKYILAQSGKKNYFLVIVK